MNDKQKLNSSTNWFLRHNGSSGIHWELIGCHLWRTSILIRLSKTKQSKIKQEQFNDLAKCYDIQLAEICWMGGCVSSVCVCKTDGNNISDCSSGIGGSVKFQVHSV